VGIHLTLSAKIDQGQLVTAPLVPTRNELDARLQRFSTLRHCQTKERATESTNFRLHRRASARPYSGRHGAGSGGDTARAPALEFESGDWPSRAFIQAIAPPPHVLICGAAPDAVPVASFARCLGWRVTVVDHRPAYAIVDRFPGAEVHLVDARDLRSVVDLNLCHAAVVMSHQLPADTQYPEELADAGTPAYVGLLGPTARRRRLATNLGARIDQLESRLRGPVGFDLGAVTSEGIALAIVSQIHAWLAGKTGVPFPPCE
jgi:xanthine/CO dehydrogenase XdhC/CoxF family maturation factor